MNQLNETVELAVKHAIMENTPMGMISAPLVNQLAKLAVLSGQRKRHDVTQIVEIIRHELDVAVVHYMQT